MSKIRFIYLILLFFLELFPESIEFEYHFSLPTASKRQNWDLLQIENCLPRGKPGEPALPYQALALLLPIGTRATEIEILFSDEIILPATYKIYPQQASSIISNHKDNDFAYNHSLYQSNSFYPAQQLNHFETHFLQGYPIVLSTFTPLQYQPARGKIKFYRKAKVIVQTAADPKAQAATKFLRQDRSTLKRVQRLIDNKSALNLTETETSEAAQEILLITDQKYAADFAELQAFYLRQGLRCQILSTSQISAQYTGRDLAEKMRQAIIAAYLQNNLQYVVLAGDVEEVAYRNFYCYVDSGNGIQTSDIPADLYFSALDGSWNDDDDQYWGEPEEADLLPEVAVGRFTFSNLQELQNMIAKIISYQETPVLGELEKSLLLGEQLWDDPLTYGGDYLDLLVGEQNEHGYITAGIPAQQQIRQLYDRDLGYWDDQKLLKMINQGYVQLHHTGHANWDSSMRLQLNDITEDNFASVDGISHNFAILYTQGCNSGAFDQTDCIAEKMLQLNNFLVAGIFNSRFGWFNEGETAGPSQHLHREYVNAIYGKNILRLGAAHLESKLSSAAWVTAEDQHEFGALRYCFYSANLLGDPTLRFYSREPLTAELHWPETVELPAENLRFWVSSSAALQNAKLTFLHNDNFLVALPLDQSGQAEINCSEIITQPARVKLLFSADNLINQTYSIDFIAADPEAEMKVELFPIFPNPFNPRTFISFFISQTAWIEISVYNLKGQRVQTIMAASLESGRHKVVWNSLDNFGQAVGSGVYFIALSVDGKAVAARKCLLLK
ncbi:MAG: C25 family cysteine peptidase [Candidatus Cloacimonadales bacterium]